MLALSSQENKARTPLNFDKEITSLNQLKADFRKLDNAICLTYRDTRDDLRAALGHENFTKSTDIKFHPDNIEDALLKYIDEDSKTEKEFYEGLMKIKENVANDIVGQKIHLRTGYVIDIEAVSGIYTDMHKNDVYLVICAKNLPPFVITLDDLSKCELVSSS